MWKQGQTVVLATIGTSSAPYVDDLTTKLGTEGKVLHADNPQDKLDQTTSSIDGVWLLSNRPLNSLQFFTDIARALKPGGSFAVRQPLTTGLTPQEVLQTLILSGFVDTTVNQLMENNVASFEIICSKPPWEIGASAPLSFKKKTTVTQEAPKKPTSVWTISGDDVDDLELANEDDLLDDNDLKSAKEAANKKDDCEIGKGGQKKACKNCVCGRADAEKAPVKKDVTELPKSSCGSCYLGDAFRCSGCPYLGMPAFKPGEKVLLKTDDE